MSGTALSKSCKTFVTALPAPKKVGVNRAPSNQRVGDAPVMRAAWAATTERTMRTPWGGQRSEPTMAPVGAANSASFRRVQSPIDHDANCQTAPTVG